MSIGVEYNTFWHLNPNKLKLFSEAEQLKIKGQDFMNYMLGLYIRTAVASVLDNKAKYPKKPYFDNIDKEIEKQKFDDDLFMSQLKSWADKHNANIRAKKKLNVNSEGEGKIDDK